MIDANQSSRDLSALVASNNYERAISIFFHNGSKIIDRIQCQLSSRKNVRMNWTLEDQGLSQRLSPKKIVVEYK